jgi:serpin B
MKTPVLISFVILLLLVSCKKDDPQPAIQDPVTIELPDKASGIIQNSNAFGLNLFREVSAVEDNNLMLSPLSASVALTMALNGADGQTFDQMYQMLGYEGLTIEEVNQVYLSLTEQLLAADPKVELALANALWYRLDFNVKQSYLETMSKVFNSHIEGLDFADPSALDVMNKWASDNTNGKIPKVLDEISWQAVMFLMNALYFKGDWTWQFDPDKTSDGDFLMENGSSVTVPVMSGKLPVKVYSGNDYTAAELFYGRQNFSMIFIVPQGTVGDFIEGWGGDDYLELTAALDDISEPTEKDVFIPRFKFDFEKELNDQLKALGMTDAFDPDLADFLGISDTDIFISFVKQNTFIEVNEEGTEAAAVTTIGFEFTSIDMFAVDRPFVFAIRERTTNTLLFIGKVLDPS